jgi:hypothetical protein
MYNVTIDLTALKSKLFSPSELDFRGLSFSSTMLSGFGLSLFTQVAMLGCCTISWHKSYYNVFIVLTIAKIKKFDS